MKRKLVSSFLLGGALVWFAIHAEASTPSNPEILLGWIVTVDDNGLLVRGDRGQSMKLELTKDTNIVCLSGLQAKLMTGRATQEQTKRFDPGRVGETDEAANTDQPRFVVESSDCHFRSGDLVRIEASDRETLTTITKLASKDNEGESQ